MAKRVLTIEEIEEFSQIAIQDIRRAAREATAPAAEFINAEVVRPSLLPSVSDNR